MPLILAACYNISTGTAAKTVVKIIVFSWCPKQQTKYRTVTKRQIKATFEISTTPASLLCLSLSIFIRLINYTNRVSLVWYLTGTGYHWRCLNIQGCHFLYQTLINTLPNLQVVLAFFNCHVQPLVIIFNFFKVVLAIVLSRSTSELFIGTVVLCISFRFTWGFPFKNNSYFYT